MQTHQGPGQQGWVSLSERSCNVKDSQLRVTTEIVSEDDRKKWEYQHDGQRLEGKI